MRGALAADTSRRAPPATAAGSTRSSPPSRTVRSWPAGSAPPRRCRPRRDPAPGVRHGPSAPIRSGTGTSWHRRPGRSRPPRGRRRRRVDRDNHRLPRLWPTHCALAAASGTRTGWVGEYGRELTVGKLAVAASWRPGRAGRSPPSSTWSGPPTTSHAIAAGRTRRGHGAGGGSRCWSATPTPSPPASGTSATSAAAAPTSKPSATLAPRPVSADRPRGRPLRARRLARRRAPAGVDDQTVPRPTRRGRPVRG